MMRQITVSLVGCALLAAAAFADDAPTNTAADEPDATVDFTGGSIAAGIGYVWGHGDLIYKGHKHEFKLSGLSVVDVGAARLTGSGVVYHLNNLSDFDGNYTAVTAGLTVAGGASAAVLRNEHGVVIKLVSSTEGLRFNLSANGIGIKLRGS
ncbi:MAG TPA: hypothetical protein VME21_04540 [Steroidobacteraceae bacterium]|nr:hypothetical protein [Steroidobacteraceae bacterium]